MPTIVEALRELLTRLIRDDDRMAVAAAIARMEEAQQPDDSMLCKRHRFGASPAITGLTCVVCLSLWPNHEQQPDAAADCDCRGFHTVECAIATRKQREAAVRALVEAARASHPEHAPGCIHCSRLRAALARLRGGGQP